MCMSFPYLHAKYVRKERLALQIAILRTESPDERVAHCAHCFAVLKGIGASAFICRSREFNLSHRRCCLVALGNFRVTTYDIAFDVRQTFFPRF